MSFSRLFILIGVCVMLFNKVESSTHWMVTESGLIQPRLDSPFDMARPYDLLAFLNQEKRWDDIFAIYDDLVKQQTIIDRLWFDVGKFTDIGRQIAQDEDCVRAGNINTIDWHAALLEDGSKKIPEEEFLFPNPYYGPNTDMPDCKRMSSLTFSMFVFEHLESMIQRDNLTANPEFVLPELLSPIMTLEQFGHWVTGVLRLNTTSWLHYHMASLFWRIRGNAPKALECSRRAVLYAPREYKDIALGSLGMVLHRSGKTNDAIIVLSAAIDHDRTNYVSHFAIANAYTVIGEFNTSLKYYDETLTLNPRMELASKHKFGVLCHANLAVRIKAIRETLNKLRDELNEYNQKEAVWPKVQAEFLKTLKNGEEFEYKNVEKNYERMADITGINMREFKNQVDKNSLIKYFIDGPLYNDEKLGKQGVSAIDTIYSLERLIRHVNKNPHIGDNNFQTEQPANVKFDKETRTITLEPNIAKQPTREEKTESRPGTEKKPVTNDEDISEFETGIYMYPPSMQINRNLEDFDKEVDWPSNKLCKETAPDFPPNVEAIFPVFMPFENKGVRMKSLLTEKIGVPLSEEYELPWHPPTCPQDKEATVLTQKKSSKQQIVTEVVQTGYLRQKLLEYVSDGNIESASHMQDAEIGQRIHVVMKKKLAPKWMLLTLSSLYWRVRGNNANALHCLLTAGRWVQQTYRDVVLVSLASVYLEMGYFDEALAAAEEAFKLSLYEPGTNFILAELNMIKKHRNTYMFHLKQVVRVEPGFMNGLARNLLHGWACILKQVNTLREMDFGEGDICTHVQPLVNMVCEKDGENCQMNNIQCFSSHERADKSTLVRMLEEKGEPQQATDDMDEAFFDDFIAHSPKDHADRLAHHANFDKMVKTVDTVLKGCGPLGCHNMKPEDLALKEEDCAYHHLQLGYWLHIISFRQLLTDSDMELPLEIVTMISSNKKVPECVRPAESLDDFYLDKLSRINGEGWQPVRTLMHQFAEMFDYFDYVALGAKIAKYVDTRPGSWTGALGAGWWCGAGGRGACALRCLGAAHALAPKHHKHLPLRALAALLHMQSKQENAKEVAYLALYMMPKSKIEAFLVAVSHTYLAEYEQAIWMYRYSLTFDEKFLPAKACLHATMCLMFYGEGKMKKGE
ncbi:tetratricopeptide repeat protein 17 isoform X1 [Maniola hyperantus]|uniref:tetratricopeptide repeat protein 17 isoform X1 n=2 Tax=Aphantopus hyperantus TaxID=2795564 RepID=UPI0015693C53|nr:tetratricopeptide repeat protein 17 [Maniola hyperantus]